MFLAASLLVLSAFAVAQTFSNNYFDANFVGAVTSSNNRNDANTSTNYFYNASDANVYQTIDVRLVDHDIPVDYSSTNFYANEDAQRGEVLSRSTGVYQGHPFTYLCIKYTTNKGYVLTERNRYIIIGPREVYFITQSSLASYDDNAEFLALENSLNIKR
jgi:hypothetical protein